jgi:hypothetical protein
MMPRVVLASALTRWLPPALAGDGGEVGFPIDGTQLDQVLDQLFDQHPGLRGYVLDDQGHVRHHVAIFVDGQAIRDKSDLRLPLSQQSEVYVMQALSGG